LLFTGALSDSLGRRPVILTALVIQLASILMFVLASSIEWLFAARITQGIATGIATSALAASFVDLQPPERPTLGSTVNSATPILGLGLGALVSSALVQYAPDPLHLIYWMMLAGFVVAMVAVALIPEPATTRRALQLAPRVGVEPPVRPAFIAALPSLIAGWGVGGFYLSLGPSLALQLAESSNRILGGLAIAVLAGVGAVSIIAVREWPAKRAMRWGAVALAAGLALTVAAVALRAPLLFFGGTAVTGVGFGVAWLGVLRSLVGLASPTGRGGLIAAIFIVAYLAFSLPAVVAGYAATKIGLHDGALWYGGAVFILALAGVAGTQLVDRETK
jgi:predicted MFS family arabinose efflux permease